jgi:hypothetical protein
MRRSGQAGPRHEDALTDRLPLNRHHLDQRIQPVSCQPPKPRAVQQPAKLSRCTGATAPPDNGRRPQHRAQQVDEDQPPPGLEHPGALDQAALLVSPMVEGQGGDHQIELRIRKRQPLDNPCCDAHPRLGLQGRARGGHHTRCRIDPVKLSRPRQKSAEPAQQDTSATADIKHTVGRRRVGDGHPASDLLREALVPGPKPALLV